MSDVLIVGAGISGLATAIALGQDAGHGGMVDRIRIVEQSSAPREVSAGLQLGPNSVKSLSHLGIGSLPTMGACTPAALRIMDGRNGRTITQSPLGDWIAARHGAPYHTVSRADLANALLHRAENLGISISHGCGVQKMRRRKSGAELTLGNGESLNANVVIGADGLWSTVRQTLRPAAKPKFTGQTAWRALVPMDDLPGEIATDMVTLWLAPGFHVVHYPVEQGQRLNLAIFTEGATDAEGWDSVGDKADLLHRIAEDGHTLAGPLTELVAGADNFIKWPLFEILPSIATGVGATTLVGDAAHPMLPYLAQGAAMGLEDAVVLAGEIARQSKHDTAIETAFRAYERSRARRVARVQRAARSNARTFHMSGAMAMARNAVLGIGEQLSRGSLLRRYDWLYGGGPVPPNV